MEQDSAVGVKSEALPCDSIVADMQSQHHPLTSLGICRAVSMLTLHVVALWAQARQHKLIKHTCGICD